MPYVTVHKNIFSRIKNELSQHGPMSRKLDILLPSWLEDSSAFDQNSNLSFASVSIYVAVNVIIWLICFLFFSIYRNRYPDLFSPKIRTPPPLPTRTLFGWIIALVVIDDDNIIEFGGYDVLFFLRFYKLSAKIFLYFALYAFGIIMPVNR